MAKKTKKKEELSTYDLAVELHEVRRSKNELLAVEKKLSAQLKARIKEGDKSQDIFAIETARTLKITDREKAVAWAQEKYAHIITVDTKAAKTILSREFSLPDGFAIEDTERLVVVGGADGE